MTEKFKNTRSVMAFFNRACEKEIDQVKLRPKLYLSKALRFYKVDPVNWTHQQMINCFSHVIREAYGVRKTEVVAALKAKQRNKDKRLILDALIAKPLKYDYSKYQPKNGAKKPMKRDWSMKK